LSNNKSESYGSDIPFVFIQHIPFKAKIILLKIHNKLWKQGTFSDNKSKTGISDFSTKKLTRPYKYWMLLSYNRMVPNKIS